MRKFRVFLAAVEDPEDPVLIGRLMKLSHRSEKAARILLGKLPAQLAEGVDRDGVEYLRSFMDGVGARLQVKEVRPGSKMKRQSSAPARQPVALNLIQRFSWGFEVLTWTWRRQAPLLLMVMAAAMLSELSIAWLAGILGGVEISTDNPLALAQVLEKPLFFAVVLTLQIAVALLSVWYQAALIRMSALHMEGSREVPLGEILRSAWRRLPELTTVAVVLVLLLFLGFAVVILFVGTLFLPEYSAAAGLFTLVGLLFVCLLLAALTLAGPIAVLESVSPLAALQRARELSHGRRWRIFAALLLPGMALAIAGFVLEVLLVSLGLAASAVGLLLAGVIFYGLGLVSLFLLNFVVTSFYFEGRILTEEWEPPWELVPHPSWPADEGWTRPAGARGLRAWLELIVAALVSVVLLLAGLALLAAKMEQLPPEAAEPPAAPAWIPEQPMLQKAPEEVPDIVRQSLPDSPETAELSAPSAFSGPLLRLATGTFFAQANGSLMWLDISLEGVVGVPEETDPKDLLELHIAGVFGPGGGNLYDEQSLSPGGDRRSVILRPNGTGGFSSTYIVRLRPGVRREDVDLIAGEALLRVPTEVQGITLGSDDVGHGEDLFPDLSVSLTAMEADRAEVRVLGSRAGQRVIRLEGIDASGARIKPQSMDSIVFDGRVELKAQFSTPVEAVRLLLLEGWEESRHPFDLRVGEGLNLPLE